METNQFRNQATILVRGFTVLTAIFVYCLFWQTVNAAEFAGTMNGVTVTNSGATNTPPVAVINYTQNGDTFDFDAGASTDSDGDIKAYRWDFGDGTIGGGSIASHQFAGGSFPVTLTVVDDKGGIALVQTLAIIPITENVGNLISDGLDPKNISTNRIWAYKLPVLPKHDGVLKSISMTVDGLGKDRRFKLCLYSHDDANNLPGKLVAESITVEGIASGDTPQLVTLNIASGTPSIVANTQYWVGFQPLDNYFRYYLHYDNSQVLAFKDVATYNFSDWGTLSGGGVVHSRVGKSFISYEFLK